MKKYLIFLISLISLSACNDDEIAKVSINTDKIIGSWYLYDENYPDNAIYMKLKDGMKFINEEYINPNDTAYPRNLGIGTYTYMRSSNTISVNGVSRKPDGNYDLLLQYDVKDVDDQTLCLWNQRLYCYDYYYRVLNFYEVFVSQIINLDYPNGIKPDKIITANASIVAPSNDGSIISTGIGESFLIAQYGEKKVAYKVVVKNGVDDHANEVNCSIDDIIKKYGTPDGKVNRSNNITAIYYKTPASEPYASELQYYYDNSSRTITCIDVIYNNKIPLKNDLAYIDNKYTKQYVEELSKDFTSYSITKDFNASTYFILKGLSTGIRYGSTTFWLTHKYLRGN